MFDFEDRTLDQRIFAEVPTDHIAISLESMQFHKGSSI